MEDRYSRSMASRFFMTPKRSESYIRLLNAAEQEFFKYGYSRVRVEDIATAATISKRTFYELFASKRIILKALLLDSGYRIRQLITTTSSDDNPVVTGAQLSSFLTSISETYNRFSEACLHDIRNEYPVLFNTSNSWLRNRTQQHLRYLLQTGISQGIFRSLDVESTVQVLWVAATSALHSTSITNLKELPSVNSTTLLDILIQGISVRST